jgi:YVTN family beta-propeller protein
MKKLTLSLLALGAMVFTACEKDEPTDGPAITSSVLVANEGDFTNGVGSITAYSTGAKTTEKNVFQKANFVPPGNVLNQVYVDGDRTFLVINGNGEVIMCNTNTLKVEARFTNLGQPRQVIRVTPNKYYVTDWASNAVHVLNAASKQVVKQIAVGTGPETMLTHKGKVYVANSGGFTSDSTIFVFNAETDAIEDTITVEENPVSITVDKNNILWVLCSGRADFSVPGNSSPANIVSYNLDSNEVIRALTFTDVTKKPYRMAMDNGSNFYYIEAYQGNIFKMSVNDTVLPTTPFATGNFYSLGYDKVNNELYAGDPLNYQTNGDVYRYSSSGKLEDQFKAGLIPGSFGFK